MSRITKEEIEKTKCGRFLLSDENIYLSIYSLNSYVFEYNLLNTEDRILYHRLQDKFDARLINGVITRVREQIIELFDKDKYIEAKVYFKPKKLSENGELEFRPLHSTGLITQIAIVSMLHLFVYEIPEEEEGDPKLRLSNLSRLIPSDFYGNRVSVKPEYLFKPWKQQYQKYNQNSNDALMKYHTSLEYKYEVTLDLENFFPTINPIIIYRYISDRTAGRRRIRRCPGLHHFRRHIFRGCGRAGDQSGHHASSDRVADRVHPAAWPGTSKSREQRICRCIGFHRKLSE